MKKILSAVLAILTVISAFIAAIPVFADAGEIETYPSTQYTTPASKLKTMTMKLEYVYNAEKDYRYQLWFDELSGEFAFVDTASYDGTKGTGILFSNPYDIAVGASDISDTTRGEMLSQIVLSYTDNNKNSTSNMNSYADAAAKGGQIVFTNIKNGVRVEYAIGSLESKRLIPHWIEKSRYEEKILTVLDDAWEFMTEDEQYIYDFQMSKIGVWYNLYNPEDTLYKNNPALLETYIQQYPVLETGMAIYVLNQTGAGILKKIEDIIKKYCPDYTYDELDYDHELTGYVGTDTEAALFRVAVEYTFDDHGLIVDVPANSIRFNESLYTLNEIQLLPFFGATTLKDVENYIDRVGGYSFLPDGSGTIITYEASDGTAKTGSLGCTVYGLDQAYSSLAESEIKNRQSIYMPVFGLTQESYVTINTPRKNRPDRVDISYVRTGFFAIIEEGDAYAKVYAQHMQTPTGGSSQYNLSYAQFQIQLADKVSLSDDSAESSSVLSATAASRYTGDYIVRYLMLTDNETAEAHEITDYYEPTYVGMALAYRDYLIAHGYIEKVAAQASIPLYLEMLGAIQTTGSFLTLPTTEDTALTTFQDVIDVSQRLADAGITNQRYKLKGFYNDGLYSTVPYKISYMNVLGGKKGFQKLIDYAESASSASAATDIRIYVDFDLTSVQRNKLFDGFVLRRDSAKTMNNRYATKREYDPIFQVMEKFGNKLIVSSASYMRFYEGFTKRYTAITSNAVSMSTLGTDLYSDFDIDDLYTRSDSEEFVGSVLEKAMEDYGYVMVDGGNAYTLRYVTDVIATSLDSSRFNISAASVPFIGIVLHGYINFAGSAINMSGDVYYEILKAIENGSYPYFILCAQNSDVLKDDLNYSSYYSVNFDTWFDDIVKYYNILNKELKDVQDATIVDHVLLDAIWAEDLDTGITMLKLLEDAKAASEKAQADYYAAIAEMDRVIQENYAASSEIYKNAIQAEVNAQAANDKAKAFYDSVKAFTESYEISDVVRVTYRRNDGSLKMFYINYNGFDIVAKLEETDKNGNPQFTIIPAMSYLTADSLEIEEIGALTYEKVTAYSPSEDAANTFFTATRNYADALADPDSSSYDINRAKAAYERAESTVLETEIENVYKVTAADGTVSFMNMNMRSVILDTGDGEYVRIIAHGYETITGGEQK